MSVSCRNCETPLDGDFCRNCGQKNIDLDRPITSLVGEFLKDSLDVDGRALRTLQLLFRQPGALTSEFLRGRRLRYTPPLRLYLVVSVTFFVVVSWFASRGVLLDPGQDPDRDALSQAQFLSDELPRLMFLLLPVFAMLLKLVFRDRLYFEHLIFSLHLHSAAFILLAFILPLERVASNSWFAFLAQISVFVYLLIYIVRSVRRVYDVTRNEALLKSLLILFGYLTVVGVVIEASSNILLLTD